MTPVRRSLTSQGLTMWSLKGPRILTNFAKLSLSVFRAEAKFDSISKSCVRPPLPTSILRACKKALRSFSSFCALLKNWKVLKRKRKWIRENSYLSSKACSSFKNSTLESCSFVACHSRTLSEAEAILERHVCEGQHCIWKIVMKRNKCVQTK